MRGRVAAEIRWVANWYDKQTVIQKGKTKRVGHSKIQQRLSPSG